VGLALSFIFAGYKNMYNVRVPLVRCDSMLCDKVYQ
jgi:hypothetical protein